jgi:hypothetical protein
MFLTGGFKPTRELLVARRPPSHTSPKLEQKMNDNGEAIITKLDGEQTIAYLNGRTKRSNWLNHSESFLHAPGVSGLLVIEDDVGQGWVAYQLGEFQLSHIVVEVLKGNAEQVTATTLWALHQEHPSKDAVMENMSAASPYWPGFQQVGYFEAFRRQEMVKEIRS